MVTKQARRELSFLFLHPNIILPHNYYMKTTFKELKGKKVGEKPCSTLIEFRILLQSEAGLHQQCD
jgi:hypothetical protein